MAFTSGCILQVNSGGHDTNNGGGFDPGATFPTDLAATSATGSSPVVTSASYNFVSADEGHYLFVKSGTNWTPMFARIASTSGGAATLDCSVGSCVLWNGATPENTVAGVATTASPTGGTWGVDYSRSTTPRLTFTDLAVGGTNTQFTSAANPVGPNFVGNFLSVTSGTGFTVQRVEVVSTSGTTATVDKTMGGTSLSGGNGGLGGALAAPCMASGVQGSVAMWVFVVGNATYTLSSSANVAGGRISSGGGVAVSYIGYMTNRHPFNTDPTRPVFQSSGNSYTLMLLNGPGASCHCIDFENGNANTSIVGFDDGSNGTSCLWNCKFNAIGIGAKSSNNSIVSYCYFLANTGITPLSISSATASHVHDCVFSGNTNLVVNADFIERCTFYNTTTASQAVVSNSNGVLNCLFHTITGNTSTAVNFTTHFVKNCIFVNISGTSSYAIDRSTSVGSDWGINNAFYNCTNNYKAPSTAQYGSRAIGSIQLTGDPCTNASGGDFSLNSTAGAGALLRALAFPTTFANGLTVAGLDVGPAQVAASTGGLLIHPGMAGGARG
jgi:hypothetical protein